MERKKGKDKFHALVEECFGRGILSIERSRKFSRRARQYTVHGVILHAREGWQINYADGRKKLQEASKIAH